MGRVPRAGVAAATGRSVGVDAGEREFDGRPRRRRLGDAHGPAEQLHERRDQIQPDAGPSAVDASHRLVEDGSADRLGDAGRGPT